MEMDLITIINSVRKNAEIREMKERNTEILLSSPEYAFWVEKMNEDSDCRQTKKYRKKKTSHKELCNLHKKNKSHSKSYEEEGANYTYKDYLYNNSAKLKKVQNNNRVYCFAARKYKGLFDSEKAADNFIRFNADDIKNKNGRAPIRSYYCTLCCGWHVTSQPADNTTDKKRISHAESMLKIMGRMSRENDRRQEILKIEQSEDFENLSPTDRTLRMFMVLYKVFNDNYVKNNLRLTIKDLRHLVAFYNKNGFGENNIKTVEKILKKCRKKVIELALKQDKLYYLEEELRYFDNDGCETITLLGILNRKISLFDNEFEKGNLNKCKDLYIEITKIEYKNSYPYLKETLKAFLQRSRIKIGPFRHKINNIPRSETSITKSHLESKIDKFMTAYNESDLETCMKIRTELSSSNVDNFDHSINIYLSYAINLMDNLVRV